MSLCYLSVLFTQANLAKMLLFEEFVRIMAQLIEQIIAHLRLGCFKFKWKPFALVLRIAIKQDFKKD